MNKTTISSKTKNLLTKKLESLRNEYLKALKQHKFILDAEKRIENNVLKENVFLDSKGKRILDYNKSYHIEDTKEFTKYCKLIHKARQKEGFNLDTDHDMTFDYESSKNLHDVEDNLLNLHLELCKEITPEILKGIKTNIKHRKGAIDLLLKLDVNNP